MIALYFIIMILRVCVCHDYNTFILLETDAMTEKAPAHRPYAEDEVSVLLFEPAGTRNTGNIADDEKTVNQNDWI